jgi:hypothetical protein
VSGCTSQEKLRFHYRDQPVNVAWGKIFAIHCENHAEHTNTLYGQIATSFFIVKLEEHIVNAVLERVTQTLKGKRKVKLSLFLTN